jgi:hypothetical protein
MWDTLAPCSVRTSASFQSLYRLITYHDRLASETNGQSHIMDGHAGEWTSVLVHALLSRYENFAAPQLTLQTEDALRLASLILVAKVWRRFGVGPVRINHLAGKLLAIHSGSHADWQGYRSIQAWTLLIGLVGTENAMRAGFLNQLRDLASQYSISIRDLILEAKQVLWSEDVLPTIDTILLMETMDLLQAV